jgi:hypothetical protein
MIGSTVEGLTKGGEVPFAEAISERIHDVETRRQLIVVAAEILRRLRPREHIARAVGSLQKTIISSV